MYNLRDWTYDSSFGLSYGNHNGVWECPDLIRLPFEGKDKWVLLLNINPGGPFGGSATQYFVGSYDGKTFKCDDLPTTTRWMDYGKDHYAAVTWSNAPEGGSTPIRCPPSSSAAPTPFRGTSVWSEKGRK